MRSLWGGGQRKRGDLKEKIPTAHRSARPGRTATEGKKLLKEKGAPLGQILGADRGGGGTTRGVQRKSNHKREN